MFHLKRPLLTTLLRSMFSLGCLGGGLLFLLPACGQPNEQQVPWIAPAAGTAPTFVNTLEKQSFSSHRQYVAAEAVAMANGLYGPQANKYDHDTPALATAITYWNTTCGSSCDDVKSGNLQCVEFVTGVFASIDDQLPYSGDADQFWKLYQGKAGWQEIAANALQTNIPEPGDMIVWGGNNHGHLAIVVSEQAPVHGQDGLITIAQSNAPNAFETLTWHVNNRIDFWAGYTLQGFIRQLEIAPCLQLHAIPIQQQWEVLTIQAAVHYGLPSKYLLRQICQSGFQPDDAQNRPLVTPTGGIGIAQMSATIAAQVPRCVINFLNNAVNCAQMPGSLPTGTGIDPTKPTEALPAAAYEMFVLYQHYLHNKRLHVPQDDVAAYTMAIAAYNAGVAVVDSVVNSCGEKNWQHCLDYQQQDHHTLRYVDQVLGIKK